MTSLRTLRLITFGKGAAVTAAELHGSFESEGLAIEHTLTPSSTEQMRGLGEGRYDVASTAFDNVLAWSGREGAEFVAIAPAGSGVLLPVFGRPEIKDWEDFRGKPLAVDAVDTAFALVLRRVLLAHGLDLDKGDYSFVPAGAAGYRFESMEKGETFGAVLTPPWNQRAVEAGMTAFGDHREVLPDYPGGVYVVSRAWAVENAAAVTGFLRALAAALSWMRDPQSEELAARRVAAEEGTTLEQARSGFDLIPQSLELDVASYQVALDLRVQFGLTPPMGPDIAAYCDAAYARAALAG